MERCAVATTEVKRLKLEAETAMNFWLSTWLHSKLTWDLLKVGLASGNFPSILGD